MGFMEKALGLLGYHKEQPTEMLPIVDFATQKGAVGPLKDDLTIYRSLRSLLATTDGVTKPYSQSIWVYASVNTIAQNVSRVPFNLNKWSGKTKTLIETGEMYDLFQNPNPHMSPEQIWEATLVYLGLRGECFWIIERDNVTVQPKEIWVFDPTRFVPLIKEGNRALVGWKYKQGSEEILFAPWEIIHFKYFNPDDDLRGLAPLQAAQMGIDQDYYASRYNESFFKEGAVVGGFIQVPESLDDKQYQRLVEQFETRHKGYKRAHRIGIIEGGAKFTEAKLSQKDMDFVSLKKITREEVFAAYKTNAVVLGLYDQIQSYEGIKTAHRAFWLECLVPKIKYMTGVVNSKLIKPVLGADILAEFDLGTVESLQDDFNTKIETGYKMFQMGFPINHINDRLELGMPQVPWGNVWWAPISVMPVDSEEKPESATQPVAGTEEGKSSFIGKGKVQGVPLTLEQKSKQESDVYERIMLDDPRIAAAWKNFIAHQSALEKRCKAAVKTYFFGQRKRVLERLYAKLGNKAVETKDLADELLNFDEETEKLTKTLAPIYQLSIQWGAESIAQELGSSSFVFNPLDPKYQAFMAMKLRDIPPIIVETVQERLRATLAEGLSKGEPVDVLADRIREEYNLSATRTLTIARTETATAANGGRYIQMDKEGVKKHQWITARDEAVRHTHRVLDGSIAIIGEHFVNAAGLRTALRFPGDSNAPASEIINCRCITLPVLTKSETPPQPTKPISVSVVGPGESVSTKGDSVNQPILINVQVDNPKPKKFKLTRGADGSLTGEVDNG